MSDKRAKWKVRAKVRDKTVWLQHYDAAGAQWHWSDVSEDAAHVFTSKTTALDSAHRTWNAAADVRVVPA